MILDRELNEKGELRVKSYCDSCKKTYWSNAEGAVKHIEIKPGHYSYIVSVCPTCINKYELTLRFAMLNDTLDELLKERELGIRED